MTLILITVLQSGKPSSEHNDDFNQICIHIKYHNDVYNSNNTLFCFKANKNSALLVSFFWFWAELWLNDVWEYL